jgi:hypothetical protein
MTSDEYFNEAVKTLGAYGQKATLEDVQFKIKRSQDTINELRKVGKNIDIPMLDFTTRSLSQEGIRRMALAKQVKDTTYPVLVVEDEGKNGTRLSISQETIDKFKADKETENWTVFVEPSFIRSMTAKQLQDLSPVTEATDNKSVEKAIKNLFANFKEVHNAFDNYP